MFDDAKIDKKYETANEKIYFFKEKKEFSKRHCNKNLPKFNTWKLLK